MKTSWLIVWQTYRLKYVGTNGLRDLQTNWVMDKWINTLKHLIISGMMNKQALVQSNNLSDPFADRLIVTELINWDNERLTRWQLHNSKIIVKVWQSHMLTKWERIRKTDWKFRDQQTHIQTDWQTVRLSDKMT